jgi:acyl dehydratase
MAERYLMTPLLARGALYSPFKRPHPDAHVPPTRLVLPEVRIDLDRLARYERICGFATGADALPVTYPHVLGFPLAMRIMASRSFPLPLLGLVHTSIEITQRRALGAGEAYELGVRVAGLEPHRRGTQACVVTEARVGGELLWESRSVYLARHRTNGESEESGKSEETASTIPRESDGGASLPVRAEWRLGGDVGRRYGAASGDRNPIHLHALTARLFGFPRAIAHGMWTVARCLAEQGPQDAVRLRADFKAPVLLPGTVTYAADGPAFELHGTDTGRLHLTGDLQPMR